MTQYGVKIKGKIKLKKATTNNGYTYFSTLLATNKDYKTEEKLYLNSMVNFKDKEYKDSLGDGDIIEIEASISLSKAQYKDKELNINIFIEKIFSINGNKNYSTDSDYDKANDYDADDTDYVPDIKESDLPF